MIPRTPSPAPSPGEFLPNVTLRRGGKSPPKTPGQGATRGSPTRASLLGGAQRTPSSRPGSELMRATHAFHDLLRSEVKRTMSPTKSPLEYLHKHSNLRNFAAWDVSGRLGSIEQEFARMKSTIEKTDTQQEVWKESVEMYKSRGMSRRTN